MNKSIPDNNQSLIYLYQDSMTVLLTAKHSHLMKPLLVMLRPGAAVISLVTLFPLYLPCALCVTYI